jgi:hypothetical protein
VWGASGDRRSYHEILKNENTGEKMKYKISLLLIIILQSCASIQNVSIEEEGIYTYKKIGARASDSIATGELVDVTKVDFVKKTNQIPHQKGIQFGVGFIIHGTPVGNTVPVTVRFEHPPTKNPVTGEIKEVTEWKTRFKIGVLQRFGHGYDTEGSMPPGKYVVQLIYKGKKMFERDFYVQ